ncbi:MAG: hypothetical protein PHV06_06475, partial [bacterium]|nr:hypothetical protein [bacterium]
VASSMRKDVWEKYPLPESTFAADHQWAKNVLLNGYKIAFQPESAVIHSHDRSAVYEFKRRFIDHKINFQQYKLRLFPNIKSLYFGILGDIKNKSKIILKSDFNMIFKFYFLIKNIFVSAAQDMGTYLGAKWEKERKTDNSRLFAVLEKKIIQGV